MLRPGATAHATLVDAILARADIDREEREAFYTVALFAVDPNILPILPKHITSKTAFQSWFFANLPASIRYASTPYALPPFSYSRQRYRGWFVTQHIDAGYTTKVFRQERSIDEIARDAKMALFSDDNFTKIKKRVWPWNIIPEKLTAAVCHQNVTHIHYAILFFHHFDHTTITNTIRNAVGYMGPFNLHPIHKAYEAADYYIETQSTQSIAKWTKSVRAYEPRITPNTFETASVMDALHDIKIGCHFAHVAKGEREYGVREHATYMKMRLSIAHHHLTTAGKAFPFSYTKRWWTPKLVPDVTTLELSPRPLPEDVFTARFVHFLCENGSEYERQPFVRVVVYDNPAARIAKEEIRVLRMSESNALAFSSGVISGFGIGDTDINQEIEEGIRRESENMGVMAARERVQRKMEAIRMDREELERSLSSNTPVFFKDVVFYSIHYVYPLSTLCDSVSAIIDEDIERRNSVIRRSVLSSAQISEFLYGVMPIYDED